MVVDPYIYIGIQMKLNELTMTFVIILNCKNSLVSMVHTEIFRRCKGYMRIYYCAVVRTIKVKAASQQFLLIYLQFLSGEHAFRSLHFVRSSYK